MTRSILATMLLVVLLYFLEEAGCDKLSHGRVMATEKQSYIQPVRVFWI